MPSEQLDFIFKDGLLDPYHQVQPVKIKDGRWLINAGQFEGESTCGGYLRHAGLLNNEAMKKVEASGG